MARLGYYITRLNGKTRISTAHKKRGTILWCSSEKSILESMKEQLDYLDHWNVKLRRWQEENTYTRDTESPTNFETWCSGNLESECSGNFETECSGNLETECSGNLETECSSNLETGCSSNLDTECSGNLETWCSGDLQSECSGNLETVCSSNFETGCSGNLDTECSGNLETECSSNLETGCSANLDTECSGNLETWCSGNLQSECSGNLETMCSSNFETGCSGNLDTECSGNLETECSNNLETGCSANLHTECSGNLQSECSGNFETERSGNIEPECSGMQLAQNKMFETSVAPSYELSSEEEPFPESEDEYIPSTPESENKKRENEEYEYFKLKKIRRNLFSENLHLQETATSSTSNTELSNDTRKRKEIGVLRVQDNKVELNLKETFHFGKLHCELCKLGDGVLLTFVEAERNEEHTCVYSRKSECMFMRNHCSVELSTKTCIPAARIVGTEHQMSTNQFITSLTDFGFTGMDNASKKHYCFYCGVMRKHITDHLKNTHSYEEEVRKAQNLPAKSKEKINVFKRLRNLGDRLHDNKVLPKERIPTRRPTKCDVSEFLCCETCNSLISPLNFARHNRNCTNRPANYRHIVREKKNEVLCKTRQATSTLYDRLFDELLNPLQDDEVAHLIRCDTALRAFARHYCMSGNLRENKGKNTRMQLRLLARLFEWIQVLDESVMEYKDILIPEKYDVLIEAVLRLTHANFQTGCMTKSSTCLLLKSCIKNLADILKLHYVQLVDNEKYKDDITNLTNFISVHESRYREELNKIAYESRANTRALKNIKLPTVSDVHKFTEYVEKIAEASFNFLECKGFDYKQWLNLGKSVLILLLVFNRRRIGETSKMRIELYHQREKVGEEDRKHMNRLELLLADRFSVMKLVAKRVRQLTILLTDQHIRYLDMFLKYRSNAGVSDDNLYLFGVPNNIRYIDASDAIRKYAEKCGAEEPMTLRATLFRKQVATLSQMLQLSDNEIQQLADFMGHKVEVHKKYYRSPAAVQEVTVLSKFFMAVGDNNIGRFRGKTLSDLEVLIENETEETEDGNNAEGPDVANIGVYDEETDNDVALHVQQETIVPSSSHLNPGDEPSFDDHIHTTGSAKSPSPKKTPQKTPAHTMEHLLNFAVRKSPRRVSFTKAEKELIYEYFGKYIQNGTYPPKQMEQYSSMLKKNQDIFHKKRTVRHIYSFVQYRIKSKK